jgi:hypothetical protein
MRRDDLMRRLVDRGACGHDIGARRPGNVEQLLCEFQGAGERDGPGSGVIAARKGITGLKSRMLGRPLLHGGLETGQLVLAG